MATVVDMFQSIARHLRDYDAKPKPVLDLTDPTGRRTLPDPRVHLRDLMRYMMPDYRAKGLTWSTHQASQLDALGAAGMAPVLASVFGHEEYDNGQTSPRIQSLFGIDYQGFDTTKGKGQIRLPVLTLAANNLFALKDESLVRELPKYVAGMKMEDEKKLNESWKPLDGLVERVVQFSVDNRYQDYPARVLLDAARPVYSDGNRTKKLRDLMQPLGLKV